MENLIISTNPDTPYTPSINFNYQEATCLIQGDSYMEEPYKFYKPIIDWVKEYFNTADNLLFTLKVNYYNTATSKVLLNLFDVIRENQVKGKNITIEWYFSADDPDLKMEIEDFENDAEVVIKKIEV